MQSKLTLIVLLASALLGCATISRDAQIQAALNLTKEHFRSTASVKDDPLSTIATITTVNGFQEKQGLLGVVWDDNFLRAFINKKTGSTVTQLYQVIYYQGRGWNFYRTVNFETPAGTQSKPVTVINRDVDCTTLRYGGCTYVEHVGFVVNEKLLRMIAASYQSGQRFFWRFKIVAKSGREYYNGILPAEVAGFLEAIDLYRAAKGLSPSAGK